MSARRPTVPDESKYPPGLRGRWIRFLARIPGLGRIVEAVLGPWPGGDEDA